MGRGNHMYRGPGLGACLMPPRGGKEAPCGWSGWTRGQFCKALGDSVRMEAFGLRERWSQGRVFSDTVRLRGAPAGLGGDHRRQEEKQGATTVARETDDGGLDWPGRMRGQIPDI